MRLASLCPSLTELAFLLGRGDDVIAITTYCEEPADRVTDIETIGGTKDPDTDRLVALAPDLVLLNREENRREDADALAAAGLALHVSYPRTVEDARDLVLDLGRVLDADAAARELADAIDAEIAAHGLPTDPVPFAYLIWRKPFMAADSASYVSAVCERVGGRNVFAAAPGAEAGYPSFDAAELAALDPAVVLLSSEPFPFAEKHRVELAEATGLPLERFVLADGKDLSWHGSRTAAGLREARRCLWRTIDAR